MTSTYGELVDAGTPMSEAFLRMCDLHQACKAAPVRDRVWSYTWQHDGHAWGLLLNGTQAEVEGVAPMHAIVLRDEWPALLTGMFTGTAIHGLEVETIAAMDAEIARLTS